MGRPHDRCEAPKITQKPKYVGFGQSFSKNDKKFIRPKKVDKIIKFDNPIGIAHIEYTNEPPIFKHLQKHKEKIIKDLEKELLQINLLLLSLIHKTIGI